MGGERCGERRKAGSRIQRCANWTRTIAPTLRASAQIDRTPLAPGHAGEERWWRPAVCDSDVWPCSSSTPAIAKSTRTHTYITTRTFMKPRAACLPSLRALLPLLHTALLPCIRNVPLSAAPCIRLSAQLHARNVSPLLAIFFFRDASDSPHLSAQGLYSTSLCRLA